jgi:hypothetical protein
VPFASPIGRSGNVESSISAAVGVVEEAMVSAHVVVRPDNLAVVVDPRCRG